jgi:hypothetical protein
MHHAFLIIFLALTLPNTFALTIYYTNSSTTPPSNVSLELPSVYATVGSLPHINITYNNVTILQHDTCHLGNLVGSVLVFSGDLLYTMFSGCNNAHQANGVAIARLAQKAGAVALVIRAFDPVYPVTFN